MDIPPALDELEVTLFGPGYGECVALHVGDGSWVLVDSCINRAGEPRALQYLNDLGVDPARDVRLVVATHWHDDHIRGMARLVAACSKAVFCCASVLCRQEFLAVVGSFGPNRVPGAGSGVRELYDVFSMLNAAANRPTFALANRRVFVQGACEIWALSPNDVEFLNFLLQVGGLLPEQGETRRRIPTLSPNKVSVVLWVKIGDIAVLLGSDMEKPGWVDILRNPARPNRKASVFKIPHHGSANADEAAVWQDMLEPDRWAVLTPFRRGRQNRPRRSDVQRILSSTSKAYSTTQGKRLTGPPVPRDQMVARTIRESGINLRSVSMSNDAVRLRRSFGGQAQWRVELFGSACTLQNFVAK